MMTEKDQRKLTDKQIFFVHHTEESGTKTKPYIRCAYTAVVRKQLGPMCMQGEIRSGSNLKNDQRPQHVPTRVLDTLETIQSHRPRREMPARVCIGMTWRRLIAAGIVREWKPKLDEVFREADQLVWL